MRKAASAHLLVVALLAVCATCGGAKTKEGGKNIAPEPRRWKRRLGDIATAGEGHGGCHILRVCMCVKNA